MLAYLNLSQNALLHTTLGSHEVIMCDRKRTGPGFRRSGVLLVPQTHCFLALLVSVSTIKNEGVRLDHV